MNNLTRYEPFSDLARLDPLWDVEDVLNRFMIRPFIRGSMEMEPQIKMDVKEMDGKYLITAEVPGVKKDDIHVTVDGNRVSISAEFKQETETREGERLVRCERSHGTALRSFTLAGDIEQNKVIAKYSNGVLELALPKKVGAEHKEIAIS